jgi:DNA-binding CsgD family transcriptional regulator
MVDRKRASAASEKLARIAQSGLELDLLRTRVLDALRRAVPFEAAFWTVADPATLLFTRGVQDQLPEHTAPLFLQNEFVDDDVNRFTEVAADRKAMHTLHAATGGDLARSARYRDILQPIGLGDELRIAFADSSGVWGFLCAHRALDAKPFSPDDVAVLQRVAPVIAHGIRSAILLHASHASGSHPAVPGLVLLTEHLRYVGANDPGKLWLSRFAGHDTIAGMPSALHVVAAALRAERPGGPTRTRILTDDGWASVQPSWMELEGTRHIALLIEVPSPVELAPIIVAAHGLTPQQARVVELLCRGNSTAEITMTLQISAATVQDHLKAIFARMGVGSRRELVAHLLMGHYMPRAAVQAPLNRRGQFDR